MAVSSANNRTLDFVESGRSFIYMRNKVVLAAKTIGFDTNTLFRDVKPACTSSGTVSVF